MGNLLTWVQELIAGCVGEYFRPYSLEQVHATLIALNGVGDPAAGTIVNEYFLEHAGVAVQMDLPLVMRIVAAHFAEPLAVRFGGWGADHAVPFRSHGEHLHERSFSVQGNAFVLMGWPTAAVTGDGRPLDRLRLDMNAAGVLHKYHRSDADVDDDLYLVVGHHDGAPGGALERAAAAVRERLAADPVELPISLADVCIVAADSHTLAPPLFTGGIPVDAATLLGLMG
ncbi:MAG: hypothetical protein ACRDOL_41050 [Streptosporangiaceae bacterium]